MTRQCLYCAKELAKTSTSNFCSKDCWTEYKKLKSMNVASAVQATVMLKKNEFAGGASDSGSDVIDSQISSSARDMAFSELSQRIEAAEHMLVEKFQDLTSLIESLKFEEVSPYPEEQSSLAITAEKAEEFQNRIARLEGDLEKMEILTRGLDKLEDRFRMIEKRLKGIETSQPSTEKKKGFFAKLFG